MGIKQHNGNTKADRLAELKIRSPSIQLIKFGAIGLNAIIFSPLLIAADTEVNMAPILLLMMVTELQEIPPSIRKPLWCNDPSRKTRWQYQPG
ncbi:outer membrane autotransporter/adhesion protein [Escherichia coli]|uniref:Outer membrane autotransporter/adhesion protein n=1 Tax=Escherichia coli TaxID=562 RepID=A0A377DTE6_ECOLX|nr:outer membrane autotransporter/adhesion protein [Escherichia coli]